MRTRQRSFAARAGAPVALALALAGCSMLTLTDPYGNQYGDWYNPGANYRWQMTTCEQAIDDAKVANAERKGFMRCCMWRHGVPIDDARSCAAATG
jgi:hypothetical protein